MGIAGLLITAVNVYLFILLVRILLSYATMFWRPSPAFTPVIRVIYELTEPPMAFLRRYIPPVGGLDLSPLILFFAARYLIIPALAGMG